MGNWKVLALGSAFFAGLTAVFGKLGVAGIDPDMATLIRAAIILMLTFAIACARGLRWPSGGIARGPMGYIALSAVCTGLSWLLYYRALRTGPASRVAPIDKLSVVFAMGLAALFLGERVGARVALGGGLIVAGALLISTAG